MNMVHDPPAAWANFLGKLAADTQQWAELNPLVGRSTRALAGGGASDRGERGRQVRGVHVWYVKPNPCLTQEYYTDSGFEFNT
jgi:hypothetical protein